MAVSPNFDAEQQSWRSITGTAQEIRKLLDGYYSSSSKAQKHCPASHHSTLIPPLDLPFPDHLLVLLHKIQIPQITLQESSLRLVDTIKSLQRVHAQKYEQSCHQLLSVPRLSQLQPVSLLLEKVRDAYHLSYEKRYLPWIETQITRLRTQNNADNSKKKRAPFNNEYTPLLEMYFEYNAYPSAPDRIVLARKSMMSSRQIEVWFQNHRCRAKKEGKQLRRLGSDLLPKTLSLASLEAKMPFFMIPKDDCPSLSDSDSSEDDYVGECNLDSPDASLQPSSRNALESIAPPHAFPMTYPPTVDYLPFERKEGAFKFPPPVWARKPSTTRTSAPHHDFDEFVTMFALKLNLRESSRKKPAKKIDSVKPHNSIPWYTATVTVMPPAPHPSFVRIPHHSQPRPSTLETHPLNLPRQPPKRVVACLPKRGPSGGVLPPPSYSSQLEISTDRSRRSSLSSNTSSDGSFRSISTSSSCSSFELVTPESSPSNPLVMELPIISNMSTHQTALDEYLFSLQERTDYVPHSSTIMQSPCLSSSVIGFVSPLISSHA